MSLTAWIMWIVSVALMMGALIAFAAWLDRGQERHAAKRREAFEEEHGEDVAALKGTWRVGRKLGRTVYLQVGDNPSDADVFLGMMETVDIAQAVVDAVNAKQRREGSWTS